MAGSFLCCSRQSKRTFPPVLCFLYIYVFFYLLTFSMLHYLVILHALQLIIHNIAVCVCVCARACV